MFCYYKISIRTSIFYNINTCLFEGMKSSQTGFLCAIRSSASFQVITKTLKCSLHLNKKYNCTAESFLLLLDAINRNLDLIMVHLLSSQESKYIYSGQALRMNRFEIFSYWLYHLTLLHYHIES